MNSIVKKTGMYVIVACALVCPRVTTSSPRAVLDTVRSNPLAYQVLNVDELQLRLCLVDSSLYSYLRVYAYNTNKDLLDEYHARIKTIIYKIKKEATS